MNASQTAQAYASCFRALKEAWLDPRPCDPAGVAVLEAATFGRDALQRISFEEVAALEERRDFWINTYNGAVIDLITTLAMAAEVRRSVNEVGRFFEVRYLKVAEVPLSLDDIEHGFLRTNQRHPERLPLPLLDRPKLKAWMVHTFDPRIHFALNCGGRSCPPMRIYTAAEIDSELEQATSAFLRREVTIDPQRSVIRANPILRWHSADFAGLGGLEGLIRRYRPEDLDERTWRISWRNYDWKLWTAAKTPVRHAREMDAGRWWSELPSRSGKDT